jgi:cold shock CspA family protein
MRFDGKLDKWNDDRGFGFITPVRGGEPVFVHISAFPRDGRRPQAGEALSFEVEPAGDGKKRAVNVQRPGTRPSSPGPYPAHTSGREVASRGHRPRHNKRSAPFGGVVTVLVVLGLGGYAYSKFNARPSAEVAPVVSASEAPAGAPAKVQYRCDGRIYCSQMTSCEEATFFLKNCPGTRMDGNNDGVPCEQQWCKGPLSR